MTIQDMFYSLKKYGFVQDGDDLPPREWADGQMHEKVAGRWQVVKRIPKEKFIKSSTNENIKELSDVKTNEDLINYFFNKHGVEEVNDRIQFMDTECIVDFMKGFESLQQEFPQVKLKTIGKTSTGASYNFGGVLSFSDIYRNRAFIENEISENTKSGYWIKDASIETLARHEFGHAIEEHIIRTCGKYKTEDEMIEAWDSCTEAKSILNEAYENLRKQGVTKSLITLEKEISQYSLCNESETIAECFAIPNDKINKNSLPYEVKKIIMRKITF